MQGGFEHAPKKMKPQKADKLLKARIAELEEDPTFVWYLNNEWSRLTVKYNQLSDDIFFKKLHMHTCFLQKNPENADWPTTKNYSKYYMKLPNNQPGFYPSTYDTEQVVDMDGNKAIVQVVDMKYLNNGHSMKTGESFWFCNVRYKVSKVTLKPSNKPEHGWELRAEARQEKEALHVRSTQDAFLVFNYALDGNEERQCYGSARSVSSTLGQKLISEIFMNPDADKGEFVADHPDAASTQW